MMSVVSPVVDEVSMAYLFVRVLSCNQMLYGEAVSDMGEIAWPELRCTYVRVAYFGGRP